jgi:hypothetical protein
MSLSPRFLEVSKLFQTLGIALPPNLRDAAPQAATPANTSQL